MKTIVYVSGESETTNRECFVGNQKVDCPQTGKENITVGDRLNLLPQISSLEKRSDVFFSTLFFVVILLFAALAVFRIKIFGRSLAEYIKPIWYFILISLVVVAWQYLFGLEIEDNSMSLRISQWIWEICVAASAYKLIKVSNFSYGNLFFLGVLYSFIIHGSKITIRYLFYDKTFLYLADRFIYGSLLVMAISFVLGSMFLYFRRKGQIKF